MRIEKREEERTIKDVFNVYIAEDGTEFETERECKRYEQNVIRERQLKLLDKFMCHELEDLIPIHYDASFSEFCNYTWFKADNEEELNELEELLGEKLRANWVENTFPFYICIETEDEFSGWASEYQYTLDESKQIAQNYFKKFGLEIEFKRKEDVCES